ncbi:hypothetical protein N2152v2_010405 [Parachlorella kessleri]
MKRPRRTQAVVDNSPIEPAGVKVQYSNLPPVSRSRLEECLKDWAAWHLQRFFPGYRPPETCNGTIGVDPELLRGVQTGAAAAWEDMLCAPSEAPSANSKFNISYEQVGDVPAYDRASIAPVSCPPRYRPPGQPHYRAHPQQLYSLEASETTTHIETVGGSAGGDGGHGGGIGAGSGAGSSGISRSLAGAALPGPSAACRCRNCGSYAHGLRECWRELKLELQGEASREAAPGYRSAARRYFLVGAQPSMASKTAAHNTPAPAGSLPSAGTTGGTTAAGPSIVEDLGEDFVPLPGGPPGKSPPAEHAELPPGFGQGLQQRQGQQQAKKKKKNKRRNKRSSGNIGVLEKLDGDEFELPPGFAPYDKRSATPPAPQPPMYVATSPAPAAPQPLEQPPAAWREEDSDSGQGAPLPPPPAAYYMPPPPAYFWPYHPSGGATEHPRYHQQPPWTDPYHGHGGRGHASSPQCSGSPYLPTPQQAQLQPQPPHGCLPPGFGPPHSWRGTPSYY